jgi:hypothetical protein
MQLRPALVALALAATAASWASAALAQSRGVEPRTALVIGNAGYSFSPLANPANDARDMAEALRAAGFDVILKTDASQDSIEDGVRQLGAALKSKGGVGLFYFAGHGVQSSGENFLLPIGQGFASETDLKARAFNASEAVDAMAAARNGLNMVILDACRNNPLTTRPNATRGLSQIDSNASLFVSFSTSPGAVALDGEGRNSPYTKHLAGSIATAGLSLEDTFKRTLKGVYQETRGQQTPWISSSFFGDFTFRPGVVAKPRPAESQIAPRMDAPQPQAAAVAATGPESMLAGIYRTSGTNPNGSRYSGIAAITSAGKQVRFTWWIGQQLFTGSGHFAGRMLVVDWGQRHPVVYTFPGGDVLDGEWADGTATDRLELFARASADRAAPGGRYRVAGRNPNGTGYSGALVVTPQGGRQYDFDWTVGSSRYHGTGQLDGNVMVVNWGSATPVIYAVDADGTLKGLWSNGRAQEIASPER